MATYTTEKTRDGDLERWGDTSAADTAKTVSTSVTPRGVRKLKQVITHYSGVPVQAGVTVVLNSGLGASYDTTLNTGSANAQDTVYTPSTPITLWPDDVIDVTAPAGGGVLTSQTWIITERA